MSNEVEYDPFEYAKELAAGEDLGRGDFEERREPSGLTRGELLKRGAVGVAAVSGAGALAGTAAAETSASGKFTGTLRVLSLGVEFPIPDIAKQASEELGFTVKPILAPSEKQPQIAITSPDTFDVFGGYNYQSLLVWPSGSLQPVDTRKIRGWNQFYKLFSLRQAQPRVGALHVRRRQRAVPDDVRRPRRVDRPAAVLGRAEEQQADRPLDRRERQADRRQAATPLHRRPGGPLQRRLDGLQRRRDPEAARAALVGRVAEHEVEGAGLPAPRPGDHVPGCGVRGAGARADEVQGLRQPDAGGDRSALQDPDQVQEAGPVPCVLVGLHRLGQPHGLEGGRARVDVVARRGARQGRGRQRPLRGAQGGLPRLVQRGGNLVEGHRPGEAAGLLRLPQLELQRVPRRGDHAPGLLHRQRPEAPAVDQIGEPASRPASPLPSTTTGGAARRLRETCRASRARSATSSRASVARAARSRSASASTPPGTRIRARACTSSRP